MTSSYRAARKEKARKGVRLPIVRSNCQKKRLKNVVDGANQRNRMMSVYVCVCVCIFQVGN